VDSSQAKTQVGTPDYMAPEVLEGRPYSGAADTFSLGATLYAMVCASFPKMLALYLGQGKTLEWPATSDAMVDWRELVTRMLAVDEDGRPSLDEIALVASKLPTADQLEGISLAARNTCLLPVPVDGAVASVDEAPTAAPVPLALATRPSQPMATEVKQNQLVLLWEPAPASDTVAYYRVQAQTGGANGFTVLMDDTGSNQPIVRINTLENSSWYEFKVVAVNVAGDSPASLASVPVQTLPMPPPTPIVSSAHGAGLLSDPRGDVGSAADDPEVLARYAQCKRELRAWDSRFEKQNGRQPTESERVADPAYQSTLARFKKLKHQRRKLFRMPLSPKDSVEDLDSFLVDEAHLLISPMPPEHGSSCRSRLESAAGMGSGEGGLAPACASCASCASSTGCWAGSGHSMGSMGGSSASGSTGGHAEVPRTPPRKNPTSRGEKYNSCSPPMERASGRTSSTSPPKSGRKKSTKHKDKSRREAAREPSVSAVDMTVSVKASHPSPRPLAACDETFE